TPPTHIKHFLDTPKPLRLVCEIADEPRVKDGRTTSLVHVRSITAERDSFATNGDAMLTIVQNKRTNEKVKEFRYASLIALEGIVSTPISSRNPGEFSYRDYLELNNIFATVHVLGYRTDLSADIKSAFVNTGTIHVLIVAGMRVALVAAIMYTLFGLLRLPE